MCFAHGDHQPSPPHSDGSSAAQAAPARRGVSRSKLPYKSAIIASDETEIADTAPGKVRGYIRNGIYAYKGIPTVKPRKEAGAFRRAKAHWGSEKYRQQLVERKDCLSAKTILDGEFISNVPIGQSLPPKGKPWTYFVFALLVTRHAGKRGVREINTKYLQAISGATQEEVDDQLLDLLTTPGVECSGLRGLSNDQNLSGEYQAFTDFSIGYVTNPRNCARP
jgi:hypothetical protein